MEENNSNMYIATNQRKATIIKVVLSEEERIHTDEVIKEGCMVINTRKEW